MANLCILHKCIKSGSGGRQVSTSRSLEGLEVKAMAGALKLRGWCYVHLPASLGPSEGFHLAPRLFVENKFQSNPIHDYQAHQPLVARRVGERA